MIPGQSGRSGWVSSTWPRTVCALPGAFATTMRAGLAGLLEPGSGRVLSLAGTGRGCFARGGTAPCQIRLDEPGPGGMTLLACSPGRPRPARRPAPPCPFAGAAENGVTHASGAGPAGELHLDHHLRPHPGDRGIERLARHQHVWRLGRDAVQACLDLGQVPGRVSHCRRRPRSAAGRRDRSIRHAARRTHAGCRRAASSRARRAPHGRRTST